MNANGFTLLEVTLFLAITGLVGLIAFVGLGPRFRNVRFTDAVRSLESSLQQNLISAESSNVRLGNVSCDAGSSAFLKQIDIDPDTPGSGGAGGAENCVINGKVAIFSNSDVVYRPIVSLREKNTQGLNNECDNKDSFIKRMQHCYRARVLNDIVLTAIGQGVNKYSYANSLEKTEGLVAVGFIKDPETNQALHFSYDGMPSGNGLYLHHANIRDRIKSLASEARELCFQMDSRTAKLIFDKSLTPKINFDEGC